MNVFLYIIYYISSILFAFFTGRLYQKYQDRKEIISVLQLYHGKFYQEHKEEVENN
jgi:hypothetical protein